jgi:hypothetical protein
MNRRALLFLAVVFVALGVTTSIFAETKYEKPMGMALEKENHPSVLNSNENNEDFTYDVNEDRLAGVSSPDESVPSQMCNFIPNACDGARDVTESGRS